MAGLVLLFRLGLGKESYIHSMFNPEVLGLGRLIGISGITQVYHSSDQKLNRNELWSVGTVRNNLANIVIAS